MKFKILKINNGFVKKLDVFFWGVFLNKEFVVIIRGFFELLFVIVVMVVVLKIYLGRN